MSTRTRDGDDPEETFDALQDEANKGPHTDDGPEFDAWGIHLAAPLACCRHRLVLTLGPQIDDRRIG